MSTEGSGMTCDSIPLWACDSLPTTSAARAEGATAVAMMAWLCKPKMLSSPGLRSHSSQEHVRPSRSQGISICWEESLTFCRNARTHEEDERERQVLKMTRARNSLDPGTRAYPPRTVDLRRLPRP